MNYVIRAIESNDRHEVLEMMRAFYSSPAVFTNGGEEIFEADFNACINGSPYIEGFVFESESSILGYAMIAKSFSTEFGKKCIWIEDLYIKAEFRGLGLGSKFLSYIEKRYPDSVFRLEVEEENERAVSVYKKSGFGILPYMEMKK